MELLKTMYEKLLNGADPEFAALSDEKKVAHLRAENTTVREELKRLNKFLSELLEFRKTCM